MDEFKPHNQQARSAVILGVSHPINTNMLSILSPTSLHILFPTRSMPAMYRVFLGPLSSSQLPTLHPSILYLPDMTVCLKCISDHILVLHITLFHSLPSAYEFFSVMALAGLPAWSVWWIITPPLKQPSSSGHDSPLFMQSGPHQLIPLCLHTWSPLSLECPSPLPLPNNFYLSFKSHVRPLGIPLNGFT